MNKKQTRTLIKRIKRDAPEVQIISWRKYSPPLLDYTADRMRTYHEIDCKDTVTGHEFTVRSLADWTSRASG